LKKAQQYISVIAYIKASIMNCCEWKENKDSRFYTIRKRLKVVDYYQDYIFVLKKLNELEVLKNIILSEKQLHCFDFLRKPYSNQSDKNVRNDFMDLYNNRLNNKKILVDYFVELKESKEFTQVDKSLFKYLNEALKEEILKESVKL
jgi:hypothetical protein